jgi:hypothetical protein
VEYYWQFTDKLAIFAECAEFAQGTNLQQRPSNGTQHKLKEAQCSSSWFILIFADRDKITAFVANMCVRVCVRACLCVCVRAAPDVITQDNPPCEWRMRCSRYGTLLSHWRALSYWQVTIKLNRLYRVCAVNRMWTHGWIRPMEAEEPLTKYICVNVKGSQLPR